MLHERHMEWLVARGIDPVVITAFGLETRPRDGSNWLVAPYREQGRVINHKWRKTQRKDHRMDTGAPLILFNADDIKAAKGGQLIITEGEWDTLALKTAVGLDVPCVSVPNGADERVSEDPWSAKRYEWFEHHLADLAEVGSFVLAVDADKAGAALASDLAALLNPARCRFIEYPDGCKDLNEVLVAHGGQAVAEIIDQSKPYPIKNLYRFSEFPTPPPMEMIDVGLPGLERLFGLVPGTLTIITGWAGQGKTSLLMGMLAHLLKNRTAMAIGSFETAVWILRSRLRAGIQGWAADDRRAHQPCPADDILERLCSVVVNGGRDDDDDLTLEAILELGRVAVLRDGAKLLVLDPWNEIEHKRGRDENETDYVSRAIRLIKRFARDYNCAVWLVAHPRKPQTDGNPKPPTLYDLAGSANFANKADYGIVVYRPDITGPNVEVRVTKVRMGLPGYCGAAMLAFNPMNSSYERP